MNVRNEFFVPHCRFQQLSVYFGQTKKAGDFYETIRRAAETADMIILREKDLPPEKYREYALRCLSDANSVASRNYRIDFIKGFLAPAYGVAED